MDAPTRDVSQQALVVRASRLEDWSARLQQGVALPVRPGCSVQELLTVQLGIDPGFVRERISTVFLDGKVVDALDTVHLRDGALLALSAALPGLVGATLRMGGAYSAMRSAISRAADGTDAPLAPAATAVVRVKLFNLLIAELGPVLLGHGILLEPAEAREALAAAGAGAQQVPPGAPVLVRVTFPRE